MTGIGSGQAEWNPCLRQAAYLAAHVYTDSPMASISRSYQSRIDATDDTWEEWSDVSPNPKQEGNGLFARAYKLISWDPQSQSAVCPPCLAFRGTNFEDMSGLAIYVGIRIARPLPFGLPPLTINLGYALDPNRIEAGGSALDNFWSNQPTRAELVAEGWNVTTLVDQTETLGAADSNAFFSEGTVIDVELSILTNDSEGGDWYANLMQGLGRGPDQYLQGMEWAAQVYRSNINTLDDKRVTVTGHSLGGGLGMAASIWIMKSFPEAPLRCVVFNAAGVNPNTVAPMSITDANIIDFNVEDEILTTLGAFPNNIPFVGSIFRWAEPQIRQVGLPPPPMTALDTVRGVYPSGGASISSGILPDLWPIRRQTVRPGTPTNLIDHIDGLLARSQTASQFVREFYRWFMSDYYAAARAEYEDGFMDWNEGINDFRALLDAAGNLRDDLGPQFGVLAACFGESVKYHGMDYVIAAMERHGRGAQ